MVTNRWMCSGSGGSASITMETVRRSRNFNLLHGSVVLAAAGALARLLFGEEPSQCEADSGAASVKKAGEDVAGSGDTSKDVVTLSLRREAPIPVIVGCCVRVRNL
jgi:hypothetical protein